MTVEQKDMNLMGNGKLTFYLLFVDFSVLKINGASTN